jgi:guanylate kinase
MSSESTMPTRQGRVFVISGPSGVGKDSVIAKLLPLVDLDTVVTMTTRRIRATESDGIHYRFVTVAEFERLRDAGELLESALVHENWYGVPADSVRASIARGRDVLIKVDPQGAWSIKTLMPNATFIFLRPASIEELRGRLASRGSETEEERALRIANAERDLQDQVWFDYVVDNPNGQIETAIATLRDIILADRSAQRSTHQ